MSQKSMGSIIKKRRTELGMTQSELGDLLHVSDKAVSKWERGIACPDIMKLHDLANALNTSSCILLGEEEDAHTKIPIASGEIEVLCSESTSGVMSKKRKLLKLTLGMCMVLAVLSVKIFFLAQDSVSPDYMLSFHGEVIGIDESGLTVKKVIASGTSYGVENRVLSQEDYKLLFHENVRIVEQSKQIKHLSEIPLNRQITVWFQSSSKVPKYKGQQIENVNAVFLN